nr:alpha/beta fold hydrolase [Methanobrevibacter cuticularis]
MVNGVLYFHGSGGSCSSLRRIIDIIGVKKPLDIEKFFIIAITTLGSPNSPSPSTTGLGADFPLYSIEDMIRFQMEFLKSKFNIIHLKGLIGNSMGGFQAIEWAAKFPNTIDFLISLVSSYKVAGHNYALSKLMNHIIENDPNYNNGKYLQPLTSATKLANESTYVFGLSREFYRDKLTNDEIDLAMEELAEEGMEDDANDILYMNNAGLNYDIEDKLGNIIAKTLIVAINQDQYFPPELDAIPMSNMIKNSKLLLYDSLMGHIGTREINKVEKEIGEFLKAFK